MFSTSPRRPHRLARRVGAAAVAAVALVLVSAQSAGAAIKPPGSINSIRSSALVFVNAAAGTACTGEVSSGSFVQVAGTSFSNAGNRVGDRFWVRITTANVSTCQAGAGIALQVPAGVSLSTTGPGPTVRCKRLDPTDTTSPVNESIFTSPTCPQNPAVVNGHLILNPPGDVGWLTRPNSNPAQNQVEILVWFRADTAGVKTFTARICDLQGPLCAANPPRNASVSISSTVT
jgi:hypothetical protein